MHPDLTAPVVGLEELKADMRAVEGKIFYDVMDFVGPMVRVCEDLAVLVYRFVSTWLNQDGSVSNRTPWNCTEVLERIDGRWKIIHTHWSYIKGELAKAGASPDKAWEATWNLISEGNL